MTPDDSIFVSLVRDKLYEQSLNGEPCDAAAARIDVIQNLEQLAPDRVGLDIERIRYRDAQKQSRAQEVRKRMQRRWWAAFREFDDFLAATDVLYADLVEATRELARNTDPSQRRRALNIEDMVGGAELKCLLLLSLHARASTVGCEVKTLLESGYTEGAISRGRTLYEIMIIMLAISSRSPVDEYEVAERYAISAYFEESRIRRAAAQEPGQTESAQMSPEDQHIMRKAIQAWGTRFKEQYDWARPLIPNQGGNTRRVTFSDVDKAVGENLYRHIYTLMNDAVHAGPTNVIQRTNFNIAYLNPIGPLVDRDQAAWAGYYAVQFIMHINDVSSWAISHEAREWDAALAMGAVCLHAERTSTAFSPDEPDGSS